MSANEITTVPLREGQRTAIYCYKAMGGELCQMRAELVVVDGVWRRVGEWELAETLERVKRDD